MGWAPRDHAIRALPTDHGGAEQSKENASSSKQQRGGLSKKKEVNGVDAETKCMISRDVQARIVFELLDADGFTQTSRKRKMVGKSFQSVVTAQLGDLMVVVFENMRTATAHLFSALWTAAGSSLTRP